MPGFGSNPFGEEEFGEHNWSRQVLFDSMPAVHREADRDNGRALNFFVEAQRPMFDKLRHRIRDFHELRDPYTVRTQYSEVNTLRLGRIIILRGDLEQRGLDGSITVERDFYSPTARFRPSDLGKELTILGSSILSNNRKTLITAIISPNQVATTPTSIPGAGVGDQLTAGPTVTLTDSAALFTEDYIGKSLLVSNAFNFANNGLFVVTAFISSRS